MYKKSRIIITSDNYYDEIVKDLIDLGIDINRINTLDDYLDYVSNTFLNEVAYNFQFYAYDIQNKLRSARIVVSHVLDFFDEIKSVVDFGCGVGEFLSEFKKQAKCDVLGIDGDYLDRSLLCINENEFVAGDLTKPIDLSRKFDLAITLEVGEHLPKENAVVFVQTLCNHSGVILFCSAPPPQPGIEHINCQFPSWWVELFKRQGFVCVDCLRRKLWYNEDIHYFYR